MKEQIGTFDFYDKIMESDFGKSKEELTTWEKSVFADGITDSLYSQLLNQKKPFLMEYVRKGRKKVGVVVAIGRGRLGWSLCHISNGVEKFDRERGIKQALKRAVLYRLGEIPKSVMEVYDRLYTSSYNYYKE